MSGNLFDGEFAEECGVGFNDFAPLFGRCHQLRQLVGEAVFVAGFNDYAAAVGEQLSDSGGAAESYRRDLMEHSFDERHRPAFVFRREAYNGGGCQVFAGIFGETTKFYVMNVEVGGQLLQVGAFGAVANEAEFPVGVGACNFGKDSQKAVNPFVGIGKAPEIDYLTPLVGERVYFP